MRVFFNCALGTGAEMQSLCKGAVDRDVFEAQVIVFTGVGGKKNEIERVRRDVALMGDLKLEDFEVDGVVPGPHSDETPNWRW